MSIFRYIPEFIKQPIRNLTGMEHPYGLPLSESRRLEQMPRHERTAVRFFGSEFEVTDAASFLSAHEDIYVRQIYRFNTDRPAPVIIDAGANVGLAALYFAQHLPGAHITSIEADPIIAEILARNVAHFDLSQVTVRNGAAWTNSENVRFASDRGDAGRVSADGDVEVPGIRIRELIADRAIDLLKLDIEGAETAVLKDCAGALSGVERIFVEFHSIAGQPQSLSDILEILESEGFRYYIDRTGVCSTAPLVSRHAEAGFDLQLNIFGLRETSCR